MSSPLITTSSPIPTGCFNPCIGVQELGSGCGGNACLIGVLDECKCTLRSNLMIGIVVGIIAGGLLIVLIVIGGCLWWNSVIARRGLNVVPSEPISGATSSRRHRPDVLWEGDDWRYTPSVSSASTTAHHQLAVEGTVVVINPPSSAVDGSSNGGGSAAGAAGRNVMGSSHEPFGAEGGSSTNATTTPIMTATGGPHHTNDDYYYGGRAPQQVIVMAVHAPYSASLVLRGRLRGRLGQQPPSSAGTSPSVGRAPTTTSDDFEMGIKPSSSADNDAIAIDDMPLHVRQHYVNQQACAYYYHHPQADDNGADNNSGHATDEASIFVDGATVPVAVLAGATVIGHEEETGSAATEAHPTHDDGGDVPRNPPS